MSPAGNQLAGAASPYLRQPAENPVHWQEWAPAALAEAAKRDVPILLSVGYAACHWCHVMAHESFDDDEVAAAMNGDFVCIKVDREERPDIDSIYMIALTVLGQSGGWPLSMFLTPEGKPIVGGTYWPREDRESEGRKALGFNELLTGDVEAMKRRTSNYARRQLTWMRKLSSVRVLDVTGRDPDDVGEEIEQLWIKEAA